MVYLKSRQKPAFGVSMKNKIFMNTHTLRLPSLVSETNIIKIFMSKYYINMKDRKLKQYIN